MAPRASVYVPALVALVLLSSPSVAACATYQGTVLFPTLGAPPAPLAASHGITGAFVPVGSTYTLDAVAPVTSLCAPDGPCVATPDFNMAFYAHDEPFDTLVAVHDAAGNQGGAIPAAADYGYIYLRYGPDLLGDDSILGTEFVYTTC